jgi:PAS domain S-box-containing protein
MGGEALDDSARRFEALVEAIPQIVWSADAEGRHDYFNARWSEFTGLYPPEIDGASWERLVHPEDWSDVSERWGESLASGQPYDIEYRFLHRSGQYRWLRVMARPVHGPDGAITRWYGTSTDIEESKAFEQARELVANELDHRIRNLFALVNGLIRLSARDDAALIPFADRLQGRLATLHTAHDFIRLPATAPEKARSVQALARAILAPYADSERISVQGDDTELQNHRVTLLALVFNELATNSVKHGALANDSGSLSLRFRCEGERIALTWLETGGMAAGSEVEHQGFGSQLLALTIERQLKGKFSRTFGPTGLSFEMEIPA